MMCESYLGQFVCYPFIDYHAQVKTNLTNKQEPHTGDVYLGHEGCLHHLLLQEAGKHSNTKHAN